MTARKTFTEEDIKLGMLVAFGNDGTFIVLEPMTKKTVTIFINDIKTGKSVFSTRYDKSLIVNQINEKRWEILYDGT
mgnify:CR=1 FL=1